MPNQQSCAPHSSLQACLSLPEAEPETLLELYLRLTERQRRERFLDTYSIAQKYDLTQRTVQNWINQGRITAVPIGKKYKVDLHSVVAYLRERDRQRE